MEQHKLNSADPTTWGNHLACQILAEKLNRISDIKLNKRINKFIQDFFLLVRSMKNVEEIQRNTIINILYKHYVERLKTEKSIPEDLKTYINNILKTKWKNHYRGVPTSNEKNGKVNKPKSTVILEKLERNKRHNRRKTGEFVYDSIGQAICLDDVQELFEGDLVKEKNGNKEFTVGHIEWDEGSQLIWPNECITKSDIYAIPAYNLTLLKRN